MIKNIAIVLDGYLPDKRVEREAEALLEAGHKVSLFCFDEGRGYQIDGLKIYFFKPTVLIKKAQAIAIDFPFYHLLLKRTIKKFLEDTRPDIIHVHDMTLAGLIFSLKKRQKIVLDLHENRPDIMAFYPHISKPLGRLLINLKRWKRAENRYASAADRLILVTNEAKQDYQHLNPYITVLPNTLEKREVDEVVIDQEIINRFKPHFVIVYVGDLGLRRGIFDALQAVHLLTDKIPTVKLVLVGDSSQKHLYEKYVVSKELHSFVSFEGHQPHQKLFSYIKASDVGISPLHRNRHHDTTYANKLFQYMAMGKCQVVSDCTAQKNLIEDEKLGFSYPSNDVKSLADIILHLYHDVSLRNEIESRALEAFQTKYHWEIQKQPLIDLYDSF